jgi:hypothetical protein
MRSIPIESREGTASQASRGFRKLAERLLVLLAVPADARQKRGPRRASGGERGFLLRRAGAERGHGGAGPQRRHAPHRDRDDRDGAERCDRDWCGHQTLTPG